MKKVIKREADGFFVQLHEASEWMHAQVLELLNELDSAQARINSQRATLQAIAEIGPDHGNQLLQWCRSAAADAIKQNADEQGE